MTDSPKEDGQRGIEGLGDGLAEAWAKYAEFFGEPPHGTVAQMRALCCLLPTTALEAVRTKALGEPVCWIAMCAEGCPPSDEPVAFVRKKWAEQNAKAADRWSCGPHAVVPLYTAPPTATDEGLEPQ
jgi:hypothetical protein